MQSVCVLAVYTVCITEFHPGRAWKLSRNLHDYTSAECTVETADDEQRNCPKYVEFLDKNKFVKIIASVGFIKKHL